MDKKRRGRPKRDYTSKEERWQRHEREMAEVRKRTFVAEKPFTLRSEEDLPCLGRSCHVWNRCKYRKASENRGKCDAMF